MKIIGEAYISDGQLRCAAPRQTNPSKICNKLLANPNREGLIAGKFLCERCHKAVEVILH